MDKVVSSEHRMERALGAAQVLAGEVGVVRRPRKLVIGSPKPVIFQRGLGRGEGEWTGGAWKDRAQQRPGRNLRRLVSQAPLGGLENRPLGRWRGGGVLVGRSRCFGVR